MNNLVKKLLAGVSAAAVAGSAMLNGAIVAAQTVDPELEAAVSWMHDQGLTKYSTVDGFGPWRAIRRDEFAHMLSVFAMSNLCIVPDEAVSCDFSDEDQIDPSLRNSVNLACQLGTMSGFGGKFMPANTLTKAEALAGIVRAMNGGTKLDENVTPWWLNYHNEARANGITTASDVYSHNVVVDRYQIALMLYRARVDTADAECSEDAADDITAILEDLLGDLGGDDSEDSDDSDDSSDDSSSVTPTSDGTLEVSLSSSTPAGATVPGLSTTTVATFDVEADGDDVVLNGVVLKRKGIGSNNVIDEVSVYLVDGDGNRERLTNPRSFNSSDNEATLVFAPKVTLEDGDDASLEVVAKIGDSATVSNEEFWLSLVDADSIMANTDDVDGSFPIDGNTFEVAGVNGAQLTVSEDGSISDVELGENQAEIMAFQLENDSNSQDIFITHITVSDSQNNIDRNFENFTLKHGGTELASVPSISSEYVTFVLDTPFEIEQGESEDLNVFADVIDGAGDSVTMTFEDSIDVQGYDDVFELGIQTVIPTSPVFTQTFNITAGELTLVEVDLPFDEIREDRDDIVLAEFNAIVNQGQALLIEDLAFDLVFTQGNPTTCNGNVADVFEDFELLVTEENGNDTIYNLDLQNDMSTGAVIGETNIDIFLPDQGQVNLQLRADTLSDFSSSASFNDTCIDNIIASTTGNKPRFNVELDVDNVNNLKIIEDADNETVTDIVPSFLSFDPIEISAATVNLNGIPLSDINVVVGSTEILALRFEVDTDDVSPVFIEEFIFKAQITGTVSTINSNITAVRLYRGLPGNGTLVESQGGFEFDSNDQISFDDFDEIMVPAASTQPFYVTIDITDDSSLSGNLASLFAVSADIDDDDNNALTPTLNGGNKATSNRDITLNPTGTLSFEFDSTDTATDRPNIVLGGTTSDFLASFEITAVNEDILVEDLTLTASATNFSGLATGNTANFASAFSEVVILDDDMTTELYRESITSATMFLNDIDVLIPEGSSNIYIKLVANKIGKNETGVEEGPYTLAMTIDEAEGQSSGDDITATAGANTSNNFFSRAVRISNIEVLDSGTHFGRSLITTNNLGNGENNLGIIKITTDSSTNTNTGDGSELELLLNSVNFTVDVNGATLNSVEFERIDVTSTDSTFATTTGATGLVTVDLSTADTTAKLIEEGTTAYYLVKVTIAAGSSANSSSAQLRLDTLDATSSAEANITYKSDDASAVLTPSVFLSDTSADGIKKQFPN